MASLKVAVRVRPFNQREIDMGAQLIVDMEGKKTTLYKPNKSRDNLNEFTFDYSYASIDDNDDNYVAQDQVYEDLGTDVIECAFQGYNACVFAYGQTGSGKTFTMMGTAEAQGLIPRICKALFARMQLGEDEGIGYKTHVSYLEIYNEKVKDLLGVENIGHNLKVREHRVLGPYVENLSQHPVTDYNEIQKCIYKGSNLRTTASTNMNDTSSRSHAIFTITFVQADFRNDMPSETVSKIHLVDLAGSERANATGATGQRLKEGAHINKSLVTLGSVISALADQTVIVSNKKMSYIPYRDSVLTWLLKDSLGGNSKTIMIAAISPADCNYSETLSTLRYANRAKNIINKPTINEDPNVKLIRELRDEINKLKSLLCTDGSSLEPSLKVLEDLQKKEAQEKVLTEEWTEKWREAQTILREEKSLGLRKSGFGVVLDSEMPHLIGIHDDISTGVTLYSLKEGTTTIGTEDSDQPQDIVLSGMGIYAEHCSIALQNGNATIYPKPQAQCWLNANIIEEPARICQGDILLLGRTNMFRYNNPAEAAKLRKDPSRSRLDLSRLSLIAASRENLNSNFYCEDDASFISPFKRDRDQQRYQQQHYQSNDLLAQHNEEMNQSTTETEEQNKKILETIENALGQLKFERLQMHEHYKKKVTKLKEELHRLDKEKEDGIVMLELKEKELIARREMLLWERDNEKVQVDIIVRQLATLQSDLDTRKQKYVEFVRNELQNSGKLEQLDVNITEATPVEESSEILLIVTKSMDNYTAQYIKETVKKNRNEINQVEMYLSEKRSALTDSSNKLCDLDSKITEIEKEALKLKLKRSEMELAELEAKKKSLNLELKPIDEQNVDNQQTGNCTTDTLTFHTANSDCSIPSPSKLNFTTDLVGDTSLIVVNPEKAMSDSGVCLDSQKISHDTNNIISSSPKNSSTKSTTDDESCFSDDNSLGGGVGGLSLQDRTMNRLREKIAQQKAKIMKNLEKDSNKEVLDEQIEVLQDLQKDYLKMEMDYMQRNKKRTSCFSDGDVHSDIVPESSIADTDEGRMRHLYPSGIHDSVFNSSMARSLPSIGPYQDGEHNISVPSFLIRGAGKQTHYEYEVRINLPDARWTLLRRYSRFRELHISMKSCYGQKISQIPFPRREIFSTNSESVAKQRRRHLESYLRRLLVVCSKIPQSPIFEGSDGAAGLTKTSLTQLSPFFKKGLFESGKHGTG